MTRTPAAWLAELWRLRTEFGVDAATRKRAAIAALAAVRLPRARDVVRLHEALCFVRAYPDDRATLRAVEEALTAFDRRADLRGFRGELQDTGIAGTDIWFRFYQATAAWLCARWPEQLSVDWEDFENRERIVQILPLLMPYTESPAFDELERDARQWVTALKGPDETDAAFLVRRFAKLPVDEFCREALYDTIDVPMRLRPGADTPSRTRDRWRRAKIVFRDRPLSRARPDLRSEVAVPPRSVTAVGRREGQRLIDLARGAMITRARDLDAFCNADPNDVRILDCGDGLCFALIGARPERRLMLESSYGLLTLQNGVPIGYVLISAAFGSAAIAYNVFDTFRGGEAARVFGRVLAVAHHVFGADSFSIDPYQLGDGNDEGLRSGAFWFYQKLGFQPASRAVAAVMHRELRRMARDPSHRSDLATMRELVVDHVHLHLGAPRDDVLGKVSLGRIAAAVSRRLAASHGADRERALDEASRRASDLTGFRPDDGCSAAERLWWRRFSPVLLAIDGIAGWAPGELAAAADVVRAKAGRHESEFVRRLDAHAKLRAGLLALGRPAS
ncbi:MAG: hypothetical protein IPM29_12585 [Planctomycetes bacterium]|nr:hypothetical protein [Planctomycetota bacterium]